MENMKMERTRRQGEQNIIEKENASRRYEP